MCIWVNVSLFVYECWWAERLSNLTCMFGEYTNTNTDSHIMDSVSADFASTHFYTLSHLVRHCCFCCCLLFISRYTQIERELNRHRLNLIMLIQLKYKMILIEWTCMEHLNMGDLIIAQKLHQPKKCFKKNVASIWRTEIANAIYYWHSWKIAHKFSNICISTIDSAYGVCFYVSFCGYFCVCEF